MTSTREHDTVPCRICGSPVGAEGAIGANNPLFVCRTCGTYRLSEYAAQRLYEVTEAAYQQLLLLPNHHLISATLRERFETSKQEIWVSSFDELIVDARPLAGGYLESVDRLLLALDQRLQRLGEPVTLYERFDYPLAWVRDGAEFVELAKLGQELGFISVAGGGADELRLSVTSGGWHQLKTLRSNRAEHRQAFVAMWFQAEMASAYSTGISPALRATGYRPLRIDLVEHNEKVDDRIIAAIRQSGLLVADFTGGRGGVYFEAGFAKGLGVPVIWTCRQDWFDVHGVHFDTRQFNHILWTDPRDLEEKLRVRIQATLPTHPPIADTEQS